ncbi:spidroin-2-like [Hylobates moloch]|uniref:spidroin-2-like n=1 Tax=Hylobates moloch TaxID=81572 RepID=UPI0026747717|nr:spidroin-2-like [Hylobates moloch]
MCLNSSPSSVTSIATALLQGFAKIISASPQAKAISSHAKRPGGERARGQGEGRGRQAAAANRPAAEASGEDQHSLTQNGGAEAEAGAPGGATRPTGFPQTAASWTRAPGPGGPHWSAPGPARRGRPQPVARVAARCPRVWCRRGRRARRGCLGLTPRSAPGIGSALTSEAPREPLEEPGKGGGAARMNGAGGCSLATSGRSRAAQLAAARAGPAASRSPGSSSRVGRGPPCPLTM